jgi:hypothetical protein
VAAFVYLLIVVVALAFDLLGDRSFGAVMLSTLPIALVAVACLLVGPWLNDDWQATAWKAWLGGAVLVLGITQGFAGLGAEQAKTGELIFTYAAILMSLPFSLLTPVVINWAEPFVRDSVVLRLIVTWIVCVLAGGVSWSALRWLSSRVRREKGVVL